MGCPLLEEFNLEHCYGFKTFRVLVHQNLKKIQIHSKDGIKRVEIKAPNLYYLFLNNYKGRTAPSMNLASCTKLITLCYIGFISERFTNSLSNFPVIENLFLCIPSPCDNLNFSSHSLRRLELHSNCDLEKNDIKTANYGPFEELIYPFLTENSSPSKACMEIDTLWFKKLRSFLDKINGFKNLKLIFEENYIDVEELKALQSPPYQLDHVELNLEDIVKLPLLVAVVDAVLWCCRPRYLTLKLDRLADPKTETDVVQYTYDKLLEQEEHGRFNIRFVLHHLNGSTYHFSGLNSMLEALTQDRLLNKITFVKEEDDVDRISGLPDSIIHHIMSFLDSPKMLVRMSVLSKDWFSLTASFPILMFDIRTLLDTVGSDYYNPYRYGMDMFFKYVAYTTTRFCKQKDISAHTFDIWIPDLLYTEVDILDRYLGLILKKGVQVLVIDIYANLDRPMFRLPDMLLSASSLTSMTIRGCDLLSSLTVNVVKFKALKLLSLHFVPIDEGGIKSLIDSCPFLEEIILKRCFGLKRFCILGRPYLNKVEIYCHDGIERVDIEAPNLCYLFIDNSKGRETPSMNLDACKKLRTLCYYGFLPKGFTKYLSNFPVIENLTLCLSSHRGNLKLSIRSLRRLVLLSTPDLENIVINTPNLLLFENYGKNKKNDNHLLRDHSSQSKACMKYDTKKPVDTLWFQKLRRFLDKNSGFRILKLFITAKSVDIEKLKMLNSSPYELEHVELHLANKLKLQVAVVDAVLWCSRSRSLTLRLDDHVNVSKTRTYVVKYTYEKLLQQEDRGHYNIRIVLCYSSEAKQHFSDLNSMLESLSRCDQPIDTFTFIKEEVVQEA